MTADDPSPPANGPLTARTALLGAAWRGVIPPDPSWLESYATAWPMNRAIEALLAAGADRGQLTALVRAMQFDLLMSVAQLLDDGRDRAHPAHRWRVFEVDDQGHPVRAMVALHESVLAADPTGQADRDAWA